LPWAVQLSDIIALDRYEPPAVHHLLDQDARRTVIGEYFRLDLAESKHDLLVYVSAFRSNEEREADPSYAVWLDFDVP
jgi:hypothetical protein